MLQENPINRLHIFERKFLFVSSYDPSATSGRGVLYLHSHSKDCRDSHGYGSGDKGPSINDTIKMLMILLPQPISKELN